MNLENSSAVLIVFLERFRNLWFFQRLRPLRRIFPANKVDDFFSSSSTSTIFVLKNSSVILLMIWPRKLCQAFLASLLDLALANRIHLTELSKFISKIYRQDTREHDFLNMRQIFFCQNINFTPTNWRKPPAMFHRLQALQCGRDKKLPPVGFEPGLPSHQRMLTAQQTTFFGHHGPLVISAQIETLGEKRADHFTTT